MYDEYEELVRLLKDKAERFDYDGWVDTAVVMEKAADAIETLIEVIQNHDFFESLIKPRWIPVTEGPPEMQKSILGQKSSKVLVAFRYEDGTQGTDTAHTLNGEWVFEDHITVVERTITHWQPLPEPPKENGKNET